mgnify:FL=1
MEREVKEILDDFSGDEALKAKVLNGKRVDLAEELSKCQLEKQTNNRLVLMFCRTCSRNTREIRRIHRSIECRKIINICLCFLSKLFIYFFFISLVSVSRKILFKSICISFFYGKNITNHADFIIRQFISDDNFLHEVHKD